MIGAQVGIQRVVIGVIVVAAVLLDVVVRSGQFGRQRKNNKIKKNFITGTKPQMRRRIVI